MAPCEPVVNEKGKLDELMKDDSQPLPPRERGKENDQRKISPLTVTYPLKLSSGERCDFTAG